MRVCIKRKDGGVTIFYPTKEVEGEELVDLLDKMEIPDMFERESYRIMGENEMLPDPYFRNAWVDDEGVSIDIEKAKRAHVEWVEKAATKKMKLVKEQIVDAQLLNEDYTKLKALYSKLNSLPDAVAASIEGFNDLEEIKAVWPGELN